MRPLAARLGFRGLWLLVLGFIWCVFGVGLLVDPDPIAHPGVLHEHIDPHLRALAWGVTGLFAIVVGLRGLRGEDTFGHVALWVMPAFRLLSFALSWLLYLASDALASAGVPVPRMGYDGGWLAALVWGLVVMMLRLVAAWPNPSPLSPTEATRRADGQGPE